MARAKKTAAAPKVYRIDYTARRNAQDIDTLFDALSYFTGSFLDENDMEEETYEALLAVRRRIEFKREPQSWGYRPRVTLKHLALATSFVEARW